MQYETWKNIDGFPSYRISNFGRVLSLKSYNGIENKILSPCRNKKRNGYCYISTTDNGKRKNWLVHRLVAEHFIPNPERKKCINHIDCDTSNNEVENLEWVTHKENSQHMVKLGRQSHLMGEKAGNNVLKEKSVRQIIKELNRGKLMHREIAKKFKTNYSNIAHIFRGSRWNYLHHLVK